MDMTGTGLCHSDRRHGAAMPERRNLFNQKNSSSHVGYDISHQRRVPATEA